MSKAAVGGAIAISGIVLELSGFVPNAMQKGSAKLGIRLLLAGLPALLSAAAALLLVRLALYDKRPASRPQDRARVWLGRRAGQPPLH